MEDQQVNNKGKTAEAVLDTEEELVELTPAKESTRALQRKCLNLNISVSQEGLPPKRSKVDSASDQPLQSQDSPVSRPSLQSPKPGSLLRSSIRKRTRAQRKEQQEQLKVSNWVGNSNVVYQVKWVVHGGRNCPIVTQNENGPCPLLGIINVLFLGNKLTLDDNTMEISEDELMSHVHQAIIKTLPKESDDHNPDHIQNVQDAIEMLPLICTGLNVNFKFTGVRNFEYTPECLIFDILGIPLYHGWLLDPQSAEIASAIGSQSYNQLVEIIIKNKSSGDPGKVAEALIAENFLEATASQLTVHGLCELNSSLKKDELAILFRNNHFIVLLKHEDLLCQLVTDQGFLEEPDVVWETLSTINGDETFLDGAFMSSKGRVSSLNPSEEQQISQDFLVALSLQDEQNKQQDKEFGWDAYGNALGAIGMTSDEELARQLHVEEQRMAQVTASRSTTPTGEGATDAKPPSPSGQSRQGTSPKVQDEPSRSKEWKCVIS